MANGKLLRQLIRSGLDGDVGNFRAASEAVIAEERGKNHHLLANDLEKLLYGTQTDAPVSQSHVKLASAMPTNKDSGISLLEFRPTIREQRDIVLSDFARDQALTKSSWSTTVRTHCARLAFSQRESCFSVAPRVVARLLRLKSSPALCPCRWLLFALIL